MEDETTRKTVMSVVPDEMQFTRLDNDGWLLSARVPLRDGSIGLVTMRITAPLLTIHAKVLEAVTQGAVLPFVQHGAWLSDYAMDVTAQGNPSEVGGTLSMRKLGEGV